ncbi:hypothetical protein QYF61_027153, partial [Mycteria americana]
MLEKKKCHSYSKETQLIALCWALATIYQTLLGIMQHPQGEERENKPTGTAATPAPAPGTAAEPENQPVPVSVTPVDKEKCWKQKSARLVREDQKAGPSRGEEEEELVNETETTRSLSLSELRDMQKDFSHCPGEHIVAWLFGCWDNGASSLELESREAKELGSLSREGGTDKAIGKGHRPSASGGHYGDLDIEQLSKDPDEVQCTRPMWQKLVRSAPVSYASSLAVMAWKDGEGPTVDELAGQLQEYEGSISSSLISAVEKLSWEVQQLKEDRSYSPPVRT